MNECRVPEFRLWCGIGCQIVKSCDVSDTPDDNQTPINLRQLEVTILDRNGGPDIGEYWDGVLSGPCSLGTF
jgi:hypothetical protein